MSSISKKIPTLATKLNGPSTYPAWVRSIERYLDIIEIPDSKYRVWDVVTEKYQKPSETSGKASSSEGEAAERAMRMWKDADAVALLTIEKNSEEDVQASIGNCLTSAEAYKELKKAYEGKTTTEFGALVDSFSSILYDDRKASVDEHILQYERTWNTFAGISSRVDLTNDDGFGKGPKEFAGSDKAKTEFLLRSFPPFYANTIDNIKFKDPAYDDAVRRLKEYVPARQRNKNRKGDSVENPVVLKTDRKGPTKDNGKRCEYCIAKGWKGLHHTEGECYTKKREEGKKKGKTSKTKAKKGESDEDDEGASICHITIERAGEHICEKQGKFQYDTATSHHTTNQKGFLQDIKRVHIPVRAHDGSITICEIMGTLVIWHNNQTIRYEECLYDPTYSNLISGQRMGSHKLLIDNHKGLLQRKNEIEYKLEIDEHGGQWITPDDSHADIKKASKIEEAKELHERYGHISYDTLRTLPEFPSNVKKGMEPRCESCQKGKATKPAAKTNKEPIRTTRPLEQLHADLVGPIKPTTPSTQYKYLLVVTDDFSRYMTAMPLKTKDEITNALIDIINVLEKATIHHVSQMQADWGGEFRNKELAKELKQRGIILKETVPRHSETNTIAERANRTIFTMNRTAIMAAGLPKSLWDKTSKWAIYTKNRMHHKSLPNSKTPIKVFLEKDPVKARTNLRPFGQKVS